MARNLTFRLAAIILGLLLLPTPGRAQATASAPIVVLPIAGYVDGRTMKTYGQYAKDRFQGYHVGDDVEVTDVTQTVPVVAVADGRVRYVGWVKGYGGVIILEHKFEGQTVQSLYGHVSLASTKLKVGNRVTAGQFLANLGSDKSRETDGERKHLHFSLRPGRALNFRGYANTMKDVSGWLNPQDFFQTQGLDMNPSPRRFDPARHLGGGDIGLAFTIPSGWGAEYVPQLRALNLFSLSGRSSARARSQIMIFNVAAKPAGALRGFMSRSAAVTTVGKDLTATNCTITKKSATSIWLQPAWRGLSHAVWVLAGADVRHSYVVAVNPKLSAADRDSFLASLSRP